MATPTADSYSGIPAGTTSVQLGRGTPYVPPGIPASGSIMELTSATNTLDSLNPFLNSAFNPNAPNGASLNFPGKIIWGLSTYWRNIRGYCGHVFLPNLGAQGTLMGYAGTGHSQINCDAMYGFDFATETWQWYSTPLPTEGFNESTSRAVAEAFYTQGEVDLDWGDWQGDSVRWGAKAQPGRVIPVGAHTRNSFCAIPPADAGNAVGKVLIAWLTTGTNQGNIMSRGAWIFDPSTGIYQRTAQKRTSYVANVQGCTWNAQNHVGLIFGGNMAAVDVVTPGTWTITNRTLTGGAVVSNDNTLFCIGDLVVYCRNPLGGSDFFMYAAKVSELVAGNSSWTLLTKTATSLPPGYAAEGIQNCAWTLCPDNGCFYAFGKPASQTLWKMTPPAAASDTAGLLAGTWVITSETLAGATLHANVHDFARHQWVPARKGFTRVGDEIVAGLTRPLQLARPIGV